MFPGPTIYAREGDRVLVNVTNYAKYNMSIHWYEILIGTIYSSKNLTGSTY